MAQLEPSLTLTLKHLAGSGLVLPEEVQRALEHSIPIQRADTGLTSIVLWGRITTLNGKDYLVAEGTNGYTARRRVVDPHTQYLISQDGVKWATLPPVDPAIATACAALHTPLFGDPQASHAMPKPTAEAAFAADAGAGGAAAEAPAHPAEVGELMRLRTAVDAIAAATSVVPLGSLVMDGAGRAVRNPLFTGVEHPDKLEGYAHLAGALDGATGSLAQDVRGSWTLQADSFQGTTLLRSLLYPGYAFFYSARDLTWGGLYVGPGLRNDDLAFML